MRRLASTGAALGVVLLVAWPLVAAAQAPVQALAKVSFEAPKEGSTVTGPKVDAKLNIVSFKAVDAGTPVRPLEGHAHIFVDRDPMKAGETIPTDQPNIIHLGKPPYDLRSIENLKPGRHTLHAVLGDSAHKVIDPVVSSKVTFTVAAPGASPPAKPAGTGDGSLATGGIGWGALAAAGLGALAVAGRRLARR